jgi:hypothetical protein
MKIHVDDPKIKDEFRMLDPTQEETDVAVPQGATVTLILRDIDDADLVSEPRRMTFVAKDTFPPPQPGLLVIKAKKEIVEVPAPPVPEPMPMPTPEPVPEPVPEPEAPEAPEPAVETDVVDPDADSPADPDEPDVTTDDAEDAGEVSDEAPADDIPNDPAS